MVWFVLVLWRDFPSGPPPEEGATQPHEMDPIQKFDQLFLQGKDKEAWKLLLSVPCAKQRIPFRRFIERRECEDAFTVIGLAISERSHVKNPDIVVYWSWFLGWEKMQRGAKRTELVEWFVEHSYECLQKCTFPYPSFDPVSFEVALHTKVPPSGFSREAFDSFVDGNIYMERLPEMYRDFPRALSDVPPLARARFLREGDERCLAIWLCSLEVQQRARPWDVIPLPLEKRDVECDEELVWKVMNVLGSNPPLYSYYLKRMVLRYKSWLKQKELVRAIEKHPKVVDKEVILNSFPDEDEDDGWRWDE